MGSERGGEGDGELGGGDHGVGVVVGSWGGVGGGWVEEESHEVVFEGLVVGDGGRGEVDDRLGLRGCGGGVFGGGEGRVAHGGV